MKTSNRIENKNSIKTEDKIMKTSKNFYQTVVAFAITLLCITTFANDNLNVDSYFNCDCDIISIGLAFEDEAYIDDIPFNTQLVSTLSATLSMEEEAYVDDIPFDTELVALKIELAAFDFDEESIDDIPFNTEMVALNIELAAFDIDEESIDDIPFNTEMVALNIELAAFDIDEESIDDIPFDTYRIAANYYYEEALNQSFEFSVEDYINDIPYDTYCVVNQDEANQCPLDIFE